MAVSARPFTENGPNLKASRIRFHAAEMRFRGAGNNVSSSLGHGVAVSYLAEVAVVDVEKQRLESTGCWLRRLVSKSIMEPFKRLQQDYPWTKSPLVSCGPMRLIALADLAVEVSRAGGLGFIGAGSDASFLEKELEKVKQLQAGAQVLKDQEVLPIGVGFLLWAGDNLLNEALPTIAKYNPAAVWLFAPHNLDSFTQWTREVRKATNGKTKIWIQIGTLSHVNRHSFTSCDVC